MAKLGAEPAPAVGSPPEQGPEEPENVPGEVGAVSELVSPPAGHPVPSAADAPPPDPPLPPTTVPAQQTGPDDVPTVRVPPPAGTLLAGRYRLGTRIGSDAAAGAEFWRAEDTVLRRDVAVTVLRRLTTEEGAIGGDDDPTADARASAMVVRALRAGNFEHGGCSRLLDVLGADAPGIPAGVLGAAVTEWVPGRSLAETLADGLIKPLAAARAVAPLAAAAEEAHRHGLVLGCDHPHRIRITPDGRAQLCFALPRPDVTPADDVRGLGAVLYTMLTSRWPLPGNDAAGAGLAGAETPLPAPSAVRPGVPIELDTLAMGALGPVDAPGHVHTAAAVHRMLNEVVTEDDTGATLFPPVHDGVPPAPDDIWQDRGRVTPTKDPRRRRKLTVGVALLAVLLLGVIGFVGTQVAWMFSDGSGPAVVVGSGASGPAGGGAVEAPTDPGRIAAVATASVYDTNGQPDHVAQVSHVIDGDKRSSWRTDEYLQQLPALKPGIGVMMSFASAVQLSQLTISSPSAGTVVEIRSAPANDTPFGDTTLITSATLRSGVTTVSLAESQAVTHVLLWITKLSGDPGKYVSEIDEVQFQRAGN